MVLYSLSFLFLFLPIGIVLFASFKNKKNILLFLSVIFLLLSNIWISLILMLGILLDYILAIVVYYKKKSKKIRIFLLSTAVLKALIFILYAGLTVTIDDFAMHITIMMVTLSSLGYFIDIYKGKTKLIQDFKDFFLYTTFFGRIQSGSLMASNPFVLQLNKLKFSYDNITVGLIKFLHGLALKVIVVNQLSFIFSEIRQFQPEERTVLSTWLLVIVASLTLYFTLLSFNIMSIGVCKIFSIIIPKNFSVFNAKFSISNFISRFNMTVNAYVSKYLYLNLRGPSSQGFVNSVNIIITSIFMVVWFGVSWNLILGGIYIGILLIFEVYIVSPYFKYIPSFFAWLYMTGSILVFATIFIGSSPMESVGYIQTMLGFGDVVFINNNIIYILSNHFVMIGVVSLLCTGLLGKTSTIIYGRNKVYGYFAGIFDLLLFIITVAFMLV